MHWRTQHLATTKVSLNSVLGILFAGLAGHSHDAKAIPLQIDSPDTRSYLVEETLRPAADVPQIEQSSVLLPLDPETGTATLSLSKYKVPSESVLLQEVGLQAGPQVDGAVRQAMLWVTQNMSASARADYAQKCEQNFLPLSQSLKLTPEALACVPWAMEKFNATTQPPREARSSSRPSGSGRVRSENDWKSQLKGVGFLDAFWRIDPQTNAELLAEAKIAANLGQDCQYRGAAAALIARAEAFFPDAAAIAAIEKVYPMAFSCLEPDEEGFERTHLRTGLFRLMRGEIQRARQSLLLAAHAENPEEEFRSLFWLGVIDEGASSRDIASGRNEYWEMLRKRYPLTIHSVISGHTVGADPLITAISNKDVNIARRVGVSWSEYNLAAFFFELLITRKEAGFLNSFAKFSARIVNAPNPDALLFLSRCYSVAQAHKISISTLTRYFRETQSQGLTIETMNMFFPRAYTDQILSSTGLVDPVIVLSLIRQESAFDPLARSGADARGLMQLLPSTASKWLQNSRQELYDPSQNVRVGVKYMETLFKRYDGNVEHVLAAYNAGLRNLDRWRQRFPNASTLMFMDLIPFKETRTYVAIILRNAYWYGRLMALQKDNLSDTIVRKSTQAKWRSVTIQNLLNLAWSQNVNGEAQTRTSLAQLYSVPVSAQ
jgi:hypothetical protein